MKRYKIILVENDEDERIFMKEGFDEAGLFDVVAQLTNGDELLAWLERHPSALPDVVLSDLNMPGKNGYDIIEFMTQTPAYARIPVIITSTSSTRMTRDKCMSLGAAGFIVKPETFVEYVPYVKQLHQLIEQQQLVK